MKFDFQGIQLVVPTTGLNVWMKLCALTMMMEAGVVSVLQEFWVMVVKAMTTQDASFVCICFCKFRRFYSVVDMCAFYFNGSRM